jgi:hypothetical protein
MGQIGIWFREKLTDDPNGSIIDFTLISGLISVRGDNNNIVRSGVLVLIIACIASSVYSQKH